MGSADLFQTTVDAPEGYSAISIQSGDHPSPVRLAVLVRNEPDELGGRLVILRTTFDAQVFLGCLLDAAGRAVKWVELWVQSTDGLSRSPEACREALSNKALDQRWSRLFRASQANQDSIVITTGWESSHPLPLFIDPAKKSVMHPVDSKSGGAWRLCEDDGLLALKDLPRYSTSVARYLYIPELKADTPFVPVTAGAPTNQHTQSLSDIAPKHLIALNPGGGLMMVQDFSPIEAEQFVDVLGGAPWSGLQHGRTSVQCRKPDGDGDASFNSDGSLFLDRHGRWGRLVETLHLKVKLLTDAVTSVRELVALTQSPLLNISPQSFQIKWGDAAAGLPRLWTARLALKDPGDAVVLPLATSDVQYFLRGGPSAVSIYQLESAGQSVGGRGQVRIRQITADGGGGLIVEGTLTTQERVNAAANDLLWLRLPLADQRVDLYSRLEAGAAMATGEVRFRTVTQQFGDTVSRALRAAEGVPISASHFNIIPLLSSPADLYSLGVLAVRMLLVNDQNSLPVALDALLSLARQIALEHDNSVGLRLRVQSVFDRDKRWLESLGPHRISREPISPEEAMDLIPSDVWWDILGLIIRMFPGVGPDSFCRDYGDAIPGGLHKVFDKSLAALRDILIRTRSLIVIDWRFNREIHSVIRQFAVGTAGR